MGYLAAVVMTGFVSNAPLTGQNTEVSLDEGSRAAAMAKEALSEC